MEEYTKIVALTSKRRLYVVNKRFCDLINTCIFVDVNMRRENNKRSSTDSYRWFAYPPSRPSLRL